MFLDDSVVNVGKTGYLYVSIGNLTRNCQRVKSGTPLGTAVPVIFVREAIPQPVYEDEPYLSPSICKHETDRTKKINFICKVYDEMNIDTKKNTSSSEFEFLSSADPFVDGLSEREVKNTPIRT